MLYNRVVTLLVETDEGRPEDWDWSYLVKAGPRTKVTLLNVEKEDE